MDDDLATDAGLAAAADDIAEELNPPIEGEFKVVAEEGTPATGDKGPTAPAAATPVKSGAAGDGTPAPVADPAGLPPAPDTLRGPIKEKWATLEPAVREEFIKRESDFRKGMDEIRPSAELGDGFTKVLAPYLDFYRQYGVNPVSHVENLTKYHAILMAGNPQQKAEILLGLARDSGIDIRALANGHIARDPGDATQREIAALRTQLTSVTGRLSAQDSVALEQRVMEFGDDVANHPYFWELAPAIAEMYKVNPRMPLELAYKTALAANPGIYDRLLDERAAAKLAAQQKEAQERVAAARKARGTRLQSSSSSRPASGDGDFDLDKILVDGLAAINAR